MYKLGFVSISLCLAVYLIFTNQSAEAKPPAPLKLSICIKNAADLETHKENLPSYFQNLPVSLGAETTVLTMDIIAVLNIGLESDNLFLKSDVWKFGTRYQDTVEIENVCFDTFKNKMFVKYRNGITSIIDYTPKEITVDGVGLKQLDFKGQKMLADKIKRKEGIRQIEAIPVEGANK